MYKIFTLKNGLKLCAFNMPDMKSVSCGIWIRSGGRYEDKKNCGISHFLEHMLFKGTYRRNSRQLKEIIEGVGGQLNGFTAEEFTCYFIKIVKKKLPLAVDVLSDMVLNPRLSEEDMELERRVIMEEIKMYLDQPAHHVHDLLNEVMFSRHPLGMPLAGTMESVRGIENKHIVSYKNRFYTPSNIVIAACGALDFEGFKKDAVSLFSKTEIGSPSKFTRATSLSDGPRFKILFKETEQTHLCLGTYAPSRNDTRRFTMSLLNVILGGNMSSRLFQELRERLGLTYDIGSQFRRYSDIGAFVISAGVENTKLKDTLIAILRELKKIKKGPPKEEELRRAKEFYTGQLLISLEDTLDHMFWLGENIAAGSRFYKVDEVIRFINKVKTEDIVQMADEIFSGEFLKIAIIGPHKEKMAKSLKDILILK